MKATGFALLVVLVHEAAIAETYNSPRLNGHMIGSCISSYRFPDECGSAARRMITNTFCRHQGSPRSTSWRANDVEAGNPIQSYDYLQLSIQRRPDGGERGQWVPDTGAAIFTRIDCL